MPSETREIIITRAKKIFAKNGYEGFSMRTLAEDCGVGLSSIYHFFSDKDVLLKEIFDRVSSDLGKKRARLPERTNASEMLYDRIQFQFKYIEDIIFVLKYYIHFRPKFLKISSGYIPVKAYLHIEEVLRLGVKNGEFYINEAEIGKESKVIAHAINGFLLEYYPKPPHGKELTEVVSSIHAFLIRSLTNKEVVMK